ncbi:hypothetical protein [Pseudoalteromonas lipolytica]|uniref:N-acetyltransferase domain-containing protein n=1 Tax=Pseudoalteromonas lipolytica TaxID=570156 RepID=A0A0P7EC77_9GAMM|nr:hypothetical protein [Pseudoalteromonas lipolytica]KPM85550.1 hypothetical protein AOG27_01865 [Pseudoalteromonas lipolytica]
MGSYIGKYRRLREQVASTVVEIFIDAYPELNGHLKITDINDRALQYLNHTWKPHPDLCRRVGTPDEWLNVVRSYRTSYSSRIEAAIWYDDELCALLLGKPSKKKLILKINFLEGNYEGELKGLRLRIAALYAESFAFSLGIEWVGVQSPYPGAVELYKEEGYTEKDPYDHSNDALCKRLDFDEQ